MFCRSESPYKVYIVDEAHMLSKSAWNAFLRRWKNRPEHVIFILATTEKDKIPETVQSRCEIYSFKQPTRESLSQVVSDVAKEKDMLESTLLLGTHSASRKKAPSATAHQNSSKGIICHCW